MQIRAKAIRKYVDKMITLAKDGSLHARRQVRVLSSTAEREFGWGLGWTGTGELLPLWAQHSGGSSAACVQQIAWFFAGRQGWPGGCKPLAAQEMPGPQAFSLP